MQDGYCVQACLAMLVDKPIDVVDAELQAQQLCYVQQVGQRYMRYVPPPSIQIYLARNNWLHGIRLSKWVPKEMSIAAVLDFKEHHALLAVANNSDDTSHCVLHDAERLRNNQPSVLDPACDTPQELTAYEILSVEPVYQINNGHRAQ